MVFHAPLLLFVLLAFDTTQHKVRAEQKDILPATKLLFLRDKFLEECHSCLLKRAGVERVILVSTKLSAYSYLVLGRKFVSESIVAECNATFLCSLAPAATSKQKHAK